MGSGCGTRGRDPAIPVGSRSARRGALGTGALALVLALLASACGLFGDDGPERFEYGSAPSQFSELWRPEGTGPFPAVVLVHGGSWSESTGRDLMDDVARDLADQGIAVWNIEYRRLGEDGGGFPGTFQDVAAAIDDLSGRADELDIDPDRVVFVGHSAGGQLALWAAARGQLPGGTVGAGPALLPRSVVALAPVTDLEGCARRGELESTCAFVMGASPDEAPNRYDRFSPLALVPLGVPQRLFHGAADTVVAPTDSEAYVAAAAAAGDDATLTVQPDANHFTVLDAATPAWAQVRDTILSLLG